MVDKVVGVETGRDVDRRKEWASGSEEPLIERVDRMIERLELLEQLVKRTSVSVRKIIIIIYLLFRLHDIITLRYLILTWKLLVNVNEENGGL